METNMTSASLLVKSEMPEQAVDEMAKQLKVYAKVQKDKNNTFMVNAESDAALISCNITVIFT